MSALPAASAYFECRRWRDAAPSPGARALPEETAVALSYDRETFAVMMASPQDLRDFCTGFSLSEGIIGNARDILDYDIIVTEHGIECRMTLTPERRAALAARRRRIAGPVGCGLCGLESLREAVRPLPVLQAGAAISAAALAGAVRRMAELQALNNATRAAHAAAFFDPGREALLLREDIGRHNALDKLVGAASRAGADMSRGAILLTSRVSLDLIQKTAAAGCGILAAISVPTAHAVRAAQDCGMTLIAVAREDGFDLFTHPERIDF